MEFLKKNVINSLLVLVVFLFLLHISLPIIISASYSIFVADDFSFAGAVNQHGSPLAFALYFYKNWQGTYSATFLSGVFNPLLHGGLKTLGIIMAINAILVILAIMIDIFVIIKFKLGQENIVFPLVVGTAVIYLLTQYISWDEIWYWYTGAMVYSIPYIFYLVGLILWFHYQKKQKMIYFVLVVIMGFVGGGGNLCVVAFGCWTMLLILVDDFITSRKIERMTILMFATWVACGLLNTLAPGNFSRHEASASSGLHPFLAFKYAFVTYKDRVLTYISSTDMILVLLFILIVAVIFLKETKRESFFRGIVAVVLLFLAPVIEAFPVLLGYMTTEDPASVTMPQRCYFIFDISIFVFLMGLMILMGAIIRNNISSLEIRKAWVIAMFLIMFVVANIDDYSSETAITTDIKNDIKNGEYTAYRNEMAVLYAKLEDGAGLDIVVTSEEISSDLHYYNPFYLSEDATNWVNVDIATYYGINTIQYIAE